MIAIALEHGVRLLEARGVNRSLAIAIVTVAVLGLVVGVAFTLIPPAIDQGQELVRNAPPVHPQRPRQRRCSARSTRASTSPSASSTSSGGSPR